MNVAGVESYSNECVHLYLAVPTLSEGIGKNGAHSLRGRVQDNIGGELPGRQIQIQTVAAHRQVIQVDTEEACDVKKRERG